MPEEIKCIEHFPTTLETYVEGPLLLTAFSRTEYPKIEEPLADKEEIPIPLATFEKGVFTCVNRGAKFSRLIEMGIKSYVTQDLMTRAPVIEAKDLEQALDISDYTERNSEELRSIAESTTRFGKVTSIKTYRVGNDVYVRLAMQCGDASGHNMTTKAATKLAKYLVEKFTGTRYGSDSGNLCTDKKAAAINAITGRGKTVITEIIIPREICENNLKTTPELLHRLNVAKNLQGTIAAGSQFSGNAHYANIVAAMYIATGQDIANTVEGSYGITQIKVTDNGDLYYTTTMPCLIVGTIGNGKDGESQKRCLEMMKCNVEGRQLGYNSQRLAAIIGAATALGELSLLADQTKSGRLIQAHERFER
ncbi:hydroxymethylglutaryl-CoA reductase [Candidatus Woesearchaeota archaeon]|nr:hydroxymethylglutaryl-CoA reductase [Candidatus Woesearchaeota archaeon]